MYKQHGIRISMDGKGSYNDNLFIERLWRSVKYEEVYLKATSENTIFEKLMKKAMGHSQGGLDNPGEL